MFAMQIPASVGLCHRGAAVLSVRFTTFKTIANPSVSVCV